VFRGEMCKSQAELSTLKQNFILLINTKLIFCKQESHLLTFILPEHPESHSESTDSCFLDQRIQDQNCSGR